MAETKRVAIVVRSNDPETCRVALLCGLYHLFENNEVNIILAGSQAGLDKSNRHDLAKLVDSIKQLGGVVLFCDEKQQVELSLREYCYPLLSQNDIAEIVESRIFRHLRTREIDIRAFA